MNENKERHGCIKVWLWIAIISNLCFAICYVVAIFGADTKALSLGFGALLKRSWYHSVIEIEQMWILPIPSWFHFDTICHLVVLNVGKKHLQPLFFSNFCM